MQEEGARDIRTHTHTAGHEDTQGRVAGECKCRSDKEWRPKAGQLRRIAAHHRTHHPANRQHRLLHDDIAFLLQCHRLQIRPTFPHKIIVVMISNIFEPLIEPNFMPLSLCGHAVSILQHHRIICMRSRMPEGVFLSK